MAAQVLFCFTAFLVIFLSMEGAFARSSNVKNATGIDSGKVIVKGNYNAVNLYPEKHVQKQLESFEERLVALEKPVSKPCKFDFEHGIGDWDKTGTAFNNQPTYGNNPEFRHGKGNRGNHQGDWWIAGHENRPSITDPPGKAQGDGPQGTLTSPYFTITGKYISFLIGGGCDIKLVRVELIVDKKVVKTATGKCAISMVNKTWDVGAFIGQRTRVRLVDFSSGGWGHINFDDLRGDISCGQN